MFCFRPDDGQIHCERKQTYRRCFSIRMKSMLVKRGAVGKTAGYRVCNVTNVAINTLRPGGGGYPVETY